jgi:hypothetical protein
MQLEILLLAATLLLTGTGLLLFTTVRSAATDSTLRKAINSIYFLKGLL